MAVTEEQLAEQQLIEMCLKVMEPELTRVREAIAADVFQKPLGRPLVSESRRRAITRAI
jgi:hypothetical protein